MQNATNLDLAQECAKLLKNTKNLILHGAPGTGKTYLAKQIAQQMIFGYVKQEQELTEEEKKKFNEQVEFVQFHPSYDYTDFVEGIRPINNENTNQANNDRNNTQIGFERKNGIFKEFCEQALKDTIKDSVDNFAQVWNILIETLNDKDHIKIPLLSNRGSITIELNEYGTGLANRTYENDEHKKGEWIQGQSKFFNKDQLYNIYKGLPGVPSGGHDNYRKAIINYMKNNMGLLEYKQGTSNPEKAKNFVFIIDEINRGELSKIFGELFFSIDLGYRGKEGKIRTQYANMETKQNKFDEALGIDDIEENKDNFGHFFVPQNVYIIGTMNDIDRSVESMDLAMRRRFTFKEIKAKDTQKNILASLDGNIKNTAEEKMDALNNAIWNKENKGIEGLSSDYHIGGAYFLKLNNFKDDDNKFQKLWDYNLKPLLNEYLRGQDPDGGKLKKLEEAYNPKNGTEDNTGESQK